MIFEGVNIFTHFFTRTHPREMITQMQHNYNNKAIKIQRKILQDSSFVGGTTMFWDSTLAIYAYCNEEKGFGKPKKIVENQFSVQCCWLSL